MSDQLVTRFACCEFCEHVIEYHIAPDGSTDFPRGEFMVHGRDADYITTGFRDRKAAEDYLAERLVVTKGKVRGKPSGSPSVSSSGGDTGK